MKRFGLITIVWIALLVVGFTAVFTLGRPLPTAAEELDAAMHPTPPVSEASARESADTIVRIQHGELVSVEPSIERRNDFDIDYWLITYSVPSPSGPTGVIISVGVDTGIVEVLSFP